MTFNKKTIRCPYMTSNNKCVHKHCDYKITKRKRVCGYGDARDCEMYCEWAEIANACYRASHAPQQLNDTEGEDQYDK